MECFQDIKQLVETNKLLIDPKINLGGGFNEEQLKKLRDTTKSEFESEIQKCKNTFEIETFNYQKMNAQIASMKKQLDPIFDNVKKVQTVTLPILQVERIPLINRTIDICNKMKEFRQYYQAFNKIYESLLDLRTKLNEENQQQQYVSVVFEMVALKNKIDCNFPENIYSQITLFKFTIADINDKYIESMKFFIEDLLPKFQLSNLLIYQVLLLIKAEKNKDSMSNIFKIFHISSEIVPISQKQYSKELFRNIEYACNFFVYLEEIKDLIPSDCQENVLNHMNEIIFKIQQSFENEAFPPDQNMKLESFQIISKGIIELNKNYPNIFGIDFVQKFNKTFLSKLDDKNKFQPFYIDKLLDVSKEYLRYYFDATDNSLKSIFFEIVLKSILTSCRALYYKFKKDDAENLFLCYNTIQIDCESVNIKSIYLTLKNISSQLDEKLPSEVKENNNIYRVIFREFLPGFPKYCIKIFITKDNKPNIECFEIFQYNPNIKTIWDDAKSIVPRSKSIPKFLAKMLKLDPEWEKCPYT